MQVSQVHLHRRLDELVIAALGPPQPLPAAPPVESEVHIEVIWEADDDDLAITNRFVRFSAPYEKVEIEHLPSLAAIQRVRPTTYVRTVPTQARTTMRMPAAVPPCATVPFDRVWFEQDEAQAEELAVQPPKWRRLLRSWTWLLISLAAGGAAVAYVASY